MTPEEYLRACGWDQRGIQFWTRPKDSDAEFAEVIATEDAVREQLAEDRARLAFALGDVVKRIDAIEQRLYDTSPAGRESR